MSARKADPWKAANARQIQCPECKAWIPCQRGRLALDGHIQRDHPETWQRMEAKRAELLGEPV